MNSNDLLQNITTQDGYRCLNDIVKDFPNEKLEIINATLDFLVSKNKLRRIKYQSQDGVRILLYVPPKE